MNLAIIPILKHAKWADIIQTSTYNACFPSWVVGKILNKPVVCLIMSFWGKRWIDMKGKVKGNIFKFIENIQINRSFNKFIFLSDFSKKFSYEQGLKPKNSVIINPGVDIKNYSQMLKENHVLFSGRFSKQKGVYDLIKVAKRLPKIKFIMMGWGEEEKELHKKAPNNIKFINKSIKDGKEFYEQYGKAPLFFLPSYGETFGFVLVEAMASGCAIVSTIPLGYEGSVVKIGAINEMVNSIKKLMENPQLMEKQGQKNILLSQKYTWEKFNQKLELEYEKLSRNI